MPRFRVESAGIVLAAALAGCSDTGVQSGLVPFQARGVDQVKGLSNEMKKNMQERAAAARQQPVAGPQPGVTAAAPAQPAGAAEPAGPQPGGQTQTQTPAAAQPAGPAKTTESPPAGAVEPAGPEAKG